MHSTKSKNKQSPKIQPYNFSYESMGTWWKISIWDSLPNNKILKLKSHVEAMSHDFDEAYSRFIKNSYILKLFSNPGEYAIPHDLFKMLKIYKSFFLVSGKKMTPLIGRALEEAGYDSDYSFTPHPISDVPDYDDVIQLVAPNKVIVKKSVVIDIGAIGKGYFVEKIAHYLCQQKCARFMVDGSGDIAFHSSEPDDFITVGLEHPYDSTRVIGTLQLSSGFSICSSGGNRRAWGGYHHIIDPVTKKSPNRILTSWVMCKDAAIADGLATSLFLVSPQKLQNRFEFEFAMLSKDMILSRSDGFNAQLF